MEYSNLSLPSDKHLKRKDLFKLITILLRAQDHLMHIHELKNLASGMEIASNNLSSFKTKNRLRWFFFNLFTNFNNDLILQLSQKRTLILSCLLEKIESKMTILEVQKTREHLSDETTKLAIALSLKTEEANCALREIKLLQEQLKHLTPAYFENN